MRHSESMVSYALLDNRQVPAVTQCTALIDSDRAGSLRLTWHQIALELFGKFHCDVRNSNWRASPAAWLQRVARTQTKGSCVLAWAQVRSQMYPGVCLWCGAVRVLLKTRRSDAEHKQH